MKKQITKISGTEKLVVTLRYDDECKNGHNTFSITGELYEGARGRKRHVASGCIHDDIIRFAPELEPLIKWHLMSDDGPMHYLANTLYLAGTKDCSGKEAGEPYHFKTRLKFEGSPFTHKYRDSFIEYLTTIGILSTLAPVKVLHAKDPETFGAKYTIKGYNVDWYKCPFDNLQDVKEFIEAWLTLKPVFIEVPTSWGKGKDAELEAARRSAMWPEATLAQLQSKEALLDRLPGLIAEFKEVMSTL